MCSDHYVTTGQVIYHVHVHPSPASIVYDIVLLRAGTTGERIVLVGDSSGGNFAFSVSMKLKELGLRMPDSILSIYPNVNTSSSATPSRITALWDPILPLGVMLACQAVSYNMYIGVRVPKGGRGSVVERWRLKSVALGSIPGGCLDFFSSS